MRPSALGRLLAARRAAAGRAAARLSCLALVPPPGELAQRSETAASFQLAEAVRTSHRWSLQAAREALRSARRSCAGLELLERRRLEAAERRRLRGEAAEADEANLMLAKYRP